MKVAKPILLVIVIIIIYFSITKIIPFLTGKSLGSIVEPFSSSEGLSYIAHGIDKKNCLFKNSAVGASLENTGLTIAPCDGSGGSKITSNLLNAQWKIIDQKIKVGTDDRYCVYPKGSYQSNLTGDSAIIGLCDGGTRYSVSSNGIWTIGQNPDDSVERIRAGTKMSDSCLYPNKNKTGVIIGKCVHGQVNTPAEHESNGQWTTYPVKDPAAPSATAVAPSPTPSPAPATTNKVQIKYNKYPNRCLIRDPINNSKTSIMIGDCSGINAQWNVGI